MKECSNFWFNFVIALLVVLLLMLVEIVIMIVMDKNRKVLYEDLLCKYRNINWLFRPLSVKELEMIKEAIELLKIPNEKLEISNFNVYSIRFGIDGWFHYDTNDNSLNIFIPFKNDLRISEDLCFLILVHEILHSQNRKENNVIFKTNMLEGLNQFLTIWLIETYSQKYKIPKEFSMYDEEVENVQKILNDAQVVIREVFNNYVDVNPEYFYKFIPNTYFL